MGRVGEFLATVGGRDLLDILVVALVVYGLLLLIRGTRAVQVLLGILVLVGISYAARATGLKTLENLLANFVVVMPFAVIVIFQDQIRRALATFGDTSILGLRTRQTVDSTLNAIVRASSELAKRRTGALIVMEGKQGLRDYVEKGTRLDARVSSELLINIFQTGAPLHDGAAILQGDRIAAAGCLLPLSRQMGLDGSLGTRHRAAIGLSDQTDGLSLVISEESGEVSVAIAGKLSRDLDSAQLHGMLLEHVARELGDDSSQDVEDEEASKGEATP